VSDPLSHVALMRAPRVFVGPRYLVETACMIGCGSRFAVQINPITSKTDGHPWWHVPSGSTMHPSEQQAGAVASKLAWRTKAKTESSLLASTPSFSRTSDALIR